MASLDLIRTITIKAQQQGVDATSAAVSGLSDTVDTSGKRALSVEKNFASLERRFITGAKELQEFEKIQRTLNLAVQQFPQLLEQANRILDAAATKLLGASNATSKLTAAMSENIMASKAMTAGMTAAGQAADKVANSAKIAGEASAAASKQIVTGMSAIGAKALESSIATQKLTAGLSQAGKDAATAKPFDRLIQGMTDATNASKNMITGMSAVGTEAARTGVTTNKFGDATKGARYEMLNLSRQLQDVVVSAQSGQGIFTILVQQGSQIADIFQTAAASGRNFGASLLALITPLSVTVTSIIAIGAAAAVAAFQWTQAQKAMELALLGIGRASGVTQEQINKLAESAKELSPGEAIEFATALAATGRIGIEVLTDVVNAGKDTARMFGIELPDAAKMLATAFANPAKGVDTLNERLNSFDAATVKLIKDLTAQGNILGAQQALFAGLKSGLQGIDGVISNTSRGWTALTTAIGGYWSKLGEVVARSLGFGQETRTLEQVNAEVIRLTKIIDDLESGAMPTDPFGFSAAQDAAAGFRVELEKVLALQNKMKAGQPAGTGAPLIAADVQPAIKAVLPEIDQKQQIDNNTKALENFERQVIETGGAMSTLLAAAGITWEQLRLAIERSTTASKEFKSSFQIAEQTAELNVRAATALAPAAKAAIAGERAYNDAINNRRSTTEATTLSQLAYKQSITETGVALSEAAKARELSSNQSLESAKKELEIFGQTSVKQKEELLNLQTKQQLEQAALAAHVEVDQAELRRLELINKQTAAYQDQKEKIQQLAQEVGNFINTLVSGLVEGKSATEALAASMKNLGASITAAASKKIGESIVGGAGDLISGITGLSGLGGTAGLAIGAGVSLLAGMFDTSKQQAEQKAAAEAATNAMNQANESLKSVTDSFMAFTAAADGAVTSVIKNGQQQFDQLKQAADAALAAANALVNTPGNTPAAMAAANQSRDLANASVISATARLKEFNERTIETGRESLRGAAALSEVQQALKDLDDKAKDLQEAMELVGTSSEEAAAAIKDDLTVALNRLTAKITDDLARSINDLQGTGYLNEIADLFTKMGDANLANVDPDLVSTFFTLGAQKIVDSAKLTGDAFNQLIETFPDLEGSVHEFSEEAAAAAEAVDKAADAIKAAADRLAALEDRAFAATNRGDDLNSQLARFDREAQKQRAAEIEAGGQNIARLEEVLALERMNIIDDYNAEILKQQQDAADKLAEEQRRAEQERFDTIKKANEDIINYLNGLLTSNLSPLSAKAQLDQARRLYEAQLALAQSGDVTALQNITKSADTLLNASKAFYGSSAGYQRDFTAVQGQLGSLAGGNTGLNPANDNVAAISATGFANVTMLLQRLVELAGGNSNLVAENTDAINAQTAALITEQRFSDRKVGT